MKAMENCETMNTTLPSVKKFPGYRISRSLEKSWPDFYAYLDLNQKFLMRLKHFKKINDQKTPNPCLYK